MIEIRTALIAFACGLAISFLIAKMQADEWEKEYNNLKKTLAKHFKHKMEREKTKWIKHCVDVSYSYLYYYVCEKCGCLVTGKYDYCPNCGRKAGNNDERAK